MASGRILEKYSGIWQKIGNMLFGPLADFWKKCDDGLWPNFGKCYLALWPNFGKCYSGLWPTLERDKKHQSDQANADQHRPTQANKMAGARPTQTNTGQHRPTYPTHQGSVIIFGFSENFEILGASVGISNLIFYLFKLCVDKIICCLALLKIKIILWVLKYFSCLWEFTRHRANTPKQDAHVGPVACELV